ncbi:MAG: PAS domain S-box protein [Desulfobacteraceae bacterium]|nr:PAS domain S-box protein [Desulfobacteraceae bacterium]
MIRPEDRVAHGADSNTDLVRLRQRVEVLEVENAALRRSRSELSALQELGRLVSASLSFEEVATTALQGMQAAVQPDMAFLFLRDGNRLVLRKVLPPEAGQWLESAPEHRVGECMCGLTIKEGRLLCSNDIHNDPRCTWQECKQAGIRSFAALPMRIGEEIIGVIGFASRSYRDFESQTEFLEAMGNQVSLPLANARLYESVQKELVERKRAEEALRESETQLRTLSDNLPGGLVYQLDFGEDGQQRRFTYLSAGIEALHGITVADALHDGMAIYRQVLEEDRPLLAERESMALASMTPFNAEVRLRLPSGAIRWRLLNSAPHRLPNNHLVWDGIEIDITERKQAEQALWTNQSYLQKAQEIGKIGHFSFDPISNLVEGSPELLRIFDVQGAGSLFEAFGKAVHPEDGHLIFPFIERAVKDSIPYDVEHRVRHRDGTVLHVQAKGEIINTPQGRRMVGTVQDITERKRTQEQLEILKQSIDTAPDGAYWMDKEGRFIYVNQAGCAALGYRREELMRLTIFDINPLATPERWAQVWQILKTGNNYFSQSVHRRKDGTTFPVEITSTYGRMGDQEYCNGFARDITERRQAEEALRQSEEALRTLVACLPDVIMRFDREGRHLFVSDNVRQVVSMRAEQFIGKTHRQLGFPEAHSRYWEQAIQNVYDSGQAFETEFSFSGSKGPTIFNWRLVPERDAQGAVRSVLSVCRDITLHRKVEKDYQTLFRQMVDGFALHEIICDEAGQPMDYRFLAVNQAFEKMTGLKANEVIGNTALQILPGVEHAWIETCGHVALSGEPAFLENSSIEPGKYFEVTIYSPSPNQFACIFADVTERKRAEAERDQLQVQLAQTQKMESVGRLAGGVAHDFNNMLGVILGHVEMAMMEMAPTQPLYAELMEVRQAAERSSELTRQLLAFARKQTVTPRVLDLNETVEGMLKMLRRLIGEEILLSWQPAANLAPVKVDPSQVDQILANLCVNARDAIAGVGKVTIETGMASFNEADCAEDASLMPGEFVLLTISDTGCGMDKKTLGKLFEPFFTTKEVGKGTGLGLATVYGIVKQNNGFINVESEPGQGATFKIYLPRHLSKVERLRAEIPAQAANGGPEVILLVEDEPAILKMTTVMLERLGYKVIAANTPGESIHLAETFAGKIDLLMTDVVMPEMNGRELAKKLLSLYPGMKRLFMSGYTADIIAHRGVLDENVSFIRKPFSMRDLATKVRETLEGK